jgi:hypothetical protein
MNAQILVVPPSLLKEHENDLAHLRSTRLADRPAFDLVQVAHQTASCGRGLNLPGTNEEHSRHLQPRTPSLAMLINHIPVIDSWNTVIYDPDIEIDPLDPVSITTSRAARVGSARFVSIPSNQPSRVPIAGVHLSPISSGTTSNTATLPQVDDTFLFKSLSSYRLNNDPGEAISSNTPSLFISAYDFAPRRSGDQVGPTDRGGSMPKFASQRIRRVSKASISALRKLSRAARGTARRGTLHILYNKAQVRQKELRRSEFIQRVFEYGVYLTLVASVYLILVGQPLWKGLVLELYWLCEQSFIGGAGVFLGLAVFYAYSPLFAFFEPYPENTAFGDLGGDVLSNSRSTALLIPCYKSASIIPGTLEAALKIFPKENIFVIANGNSPTPLDNTEEVCTRYGVNHTWCPIGSKIAAQFVGCYVVKDFPYVLLM